MITLLAPFFSARFLRLSRWFAALSTTCSLIMAGSQAAQAQGKLESKPTANSTDKVAFVKKLIGKASITRGTETLGARKGAALLPGDIFTTQKNAVAQIQFYGHDSFTLAAETSIEIENYSSTVEQKTSTIKALRGKLRFFVQSGEKKTQSVQIKSRNAVMGVRGTTGYVEVGEGGQPDRGMIFEGKAEVFATSSSSEPSGGAVILASGQTTSVQAGASRASPPTAIKESDLGGLREMEKKLGSNLRGPDASPGYQAVEVNAEAAASSPRPPDDVGNSSGLRNLTGIAVGASARQRTSPFTLSRLDGASALATDSARRLGRDEILQEEKLAYENTRVSFRVLIRSPQAN